ncbi:MAG TPA: metalloregulator ArsR/SmtB family transcription factor [Mobilitalea sp.]|nr:metalloregulator ArsR/SmtB family transcription factor [Mobilitalea sp.]
MVDIFKALSEESRLRILSMLLDSEMCVCSIEACLNMTQSNASRHLNVLRQSGILIGYKKAQWTYYQINEKFIEEHKDLYDYLCVKLRELPTYQIDIKNKEMYHEKNICACSINPH